MAKRSKLSVVCNFCDLVGESIVSRNAVNGHINYAEKIFKILVSIRKFPECQSLKGCSLIPFVSANVYFYQLPISSSTRILDKTRQNTEHKMLSWRNPKMQSLLSAPSRYRSEEVRTTHSCEIILPVRFVQ